jgi:hypothetical protein
LVECVDYILKTEVILSPSFPLDHLWTPKEEKATARKRIWWRRIK